MLTFIDQRIAAMLERPQAWGPPIAIELQVLLLLEVRVLALGGAEEQQARLAARYQQYLAATLGPSSLSLTDRLGLTKQHSDQFITILRGFVAEERCLTGS